MSHTDSMVTGHVEVRDTEHTSRWGTGMAEGDGALDGEGSPRRGDGLLTRETRMAIVFRRACRGFPEEE